MASLPDRTTVLVVGGGPVGKAAALTLVAYDCRVVLIDSRGPERESSRATTVHAATLELLDAFDGAGEEIVSRAAPAKRSTLWADGRPVLTWDFDRLDSRYRIMCNVPQAETEAVLVDRLGALGVEPHWHTEAIGLDRHDDHVAVTVRDADGEQASISAAWVIGCDGAHSFVRKASGIPFEGDTEEERFLLADAELSTDLDLRATHVFVSTSGAIGIMPMPRGRFRINGTVGEGVELTEDGLRDALAERAGEAGRVSIRAVEWCNDYRIHRRVAESMRAGRVFLAGDAAHIHSPVGGQGMNTGIHDAVNLGWKLALVATGRAPERLLDSYEEERLPVARQVVALSDRGSRMVASRRPFQRRLRNLAMRTMSKIGPIHDRILSNMAGTATRYEPGIAIAAGRGKPRPGTRFDLGRRARPGHVVLVGPGVDEGAVRAMAAGARVPLDVEVSADIEGIVLVRPDGVIGWSDTDPNGLGAHLTEVLGDGVPAAA